LRGGHREINPQKDPFHRLLVFDYDHPGGMPAGDNHSFPTDHFNFYLNTHLNFNLNPHANLHPGSAASGPGCFHHPLPGGYLAQGVGSLG
jgi:hypothetical protein